VAGKTEVEVTPVGNEKNQGEFGGGGKGRKMPLKNIKANRKKGPLREGKVGKGREMVK